MRDVVKALRKVKCDKNRLFPLRLQAFSNFLYVLIFNKSNISFIYLRWELEIKGEWCNIPAFIAVLSRLIDKNLFQRRLRLISLTVQGYFRLRIQSAENAVIQRKEYPITSSKA